MADWLSYAKAFANLLGGEVAGDAFAVDFLTDTIKCRLHTATYTPNRGTHETLSDLTNEVPATGGYSAGGATLGSKTIAVTAADSWATTRANTTVYAVGDIVRPATPNGHLYRCVVAGTSAGSPPSFSTVGGQDTADGTVTWNEIGTFITQLDAADPSWGPGATIAAIRYAIIVKDTGTPGTSPVLFILDFGSDQAINNGTFTVQLSALGVWTHTHP